MAREAGLPASLYSLLNRVDDGTFFGELVCGKFRVDKFTVDGDLETSAAGGYQFEIFDLLLESAQQIARQTDGFRLVVSDGTVLQFDIHDGVSQ
jgi:hypothetical protein